MSSSFLRHYDETKTLSYAIPLISPTWSDGIQLFLRNKSGVVLTQAGIYFKEYALSSLRLWERTLKKVAIKGLYYENISVGVRPGLWEPIVMNWLHWAKNNFPKVAYCVEFEIADDLISKLAAGTLDITILFSPPSLPGIVVEELYQEKFILIASPDQYPKTIPVNETSFSQYIGVDWGKEFKENIRHYFPTPIVPQLSVNLGLYGIRYLIAYGGCGYFAQSMIKEYVEEGSLLVVENAPVIKQPVFLAYSYDNNKENFSALIEGFKEIGRNIQ